MLADADAIGTPGGELTGFQARDRLSDLLVVGALQKVAEPADGQVQGAEHPRAAVEAGFAEGPDQLALRDHTGRRAL